MFKRVAEKATGWEQAQRMLKPCFANASRRPTHLRMTTVTPTIEVAFIIYKRAVRLPECLDPAAVFEELFESRGWGSSWRDGVYDYAHYHSRTHEVLGVERGSGRVRIGGKKGRALTLKAGMWQSSRRHGPPTSKCERRFSGRPEPIRRPAPTTSARRWRIARQRFPPQFRISRARARTPFTAKTVL